MHEWNLKTHSLQTFDSRIKVRFDQIFYLSVPLFLSAMKPAPCSAQRWAEIPATNARRQIYCYHSKFR